MNRPRPDPADDGGADLPSPGWPAVAGRLDPGDPHLLDRLGIVVPDDARDLDAERDALLDTGGHAPGWLDRRGGHGSRALARAVERLAQLPSAVGATVLVIALVTTAVAVSLMSALSPHARIDDRPALALATAPAAAPGAVGGLVPVENASLVDVGTVDVRSLRPAVLLVLPSGVCTACSSVLASTWRQARTDGIEVYVVAARGSTGSTEGAQELSNATTADQAPVLVDSTDALGTAYRAGGPTLVLVHADGVVGAILDRPPDEAHLTALLASLGTAGAPPSLTPAGTTRP